jgi:hypothetical protein
MGQPSAEQFGVPWSSGYGATSQTLARLGAFNRNVPVFGYEVQPTLYLLGPDGHVRWADGRARMAHEDPAPLLRRLEEEIERALAGLP